VALLPMIKKKRGQSGGVPGRTAKKMKLAP
jgi:hypothetical protein